MKSESTSKKWRRVVHFAVLLKPSSCFSNQILRKLFCPSRGILQKERKPHLKEASAAGVGRESASSGHMPTWVLCLSCLA